MDDSASDERPEWWVENRRLKEEMGLREYVPPRFDDGVYAHDIVPVLEAELECTIRFVAFNPDRPGDWRVEVDSRVAFAVERLRDDAGNSVYDISSDAFADRIRSALSE